MPRLLTYLPLAASGPPLFEYRVTCRTQLVATPIAASRSPLASPLATRPVVRHRIRCYCNCCKRRQQQYHICIFLCKHTATPATPNIPLPKRRECVHFYLILFVLDLH